MNLLFVHNLAQSNIKVVLILFPQIIMISSECSLAKMTHTVFASSHVSQLERGTLTVQSGLLKQYKPVTKAKTTVIRLVIRTSEV